MALSKGSIETLIDLVEIKLGCFEVYDRDDKRALKDLERCLHELEAMGGSTNGGKWAGEASDGPNVVNLTTQSAY